MDQHEREAGAEPTADAGRDLTRILRAGPEGAALALPLVYDELRRIAERRMAGERADHTLQATALVHEAYLKLLGEQQLDWTDRRRFYGAAAEAMRRILVDHARRVGATKRGGERQRVTFGAADVSADLDPEQVLSLSDAREQLEGEDPHAAEVTRLRFFAGLSVEEVAAALGISERSVHREWAFARARLLQFLER
jgi:RNA polymerase sigma factor (TIGR02999 family)